MYLIIIHFVKPMQKLMYQIYLSLESLAITFEDKSVNFEDK